MITIMSGYGYTGSSAFNALLLETQGCHEFGDELRFLVDPDGFLCTEAQIRSAWNPFVADLLYKRLSSLLHRLGRHKTSSYYNQHHIKNISPHWESLVEEYLNEIGILSFEGMWLGINHPWDYKRRHINKWSGGLLKLNSKKDMYMMTSDADLFVEKSKKFLKGLLAHLDKKHFLLDEGFASLNPTAALEYFDNAKVLISERDPRDVYCEIRKSNARFIPHQVEDFITWYKMVRKRNEECSTSDNVKTFRFEELVSNYEKTVMEIFKFLDINEEEHIRKREILNPDRSIKNIGKWKNSSFKDEIQLIGQSLKDYCWDN